MKILLIILTSITLFILAMIGMYQLQKKINSSNVSKEKGSNVSKEKGSNVSKEKEDKKGWCFMQDNDYSFCLEKTKEICHGPNMTRNHYKEGDKQVYFDTRQECCDAYKNYKPLDC